MKLNYAARNFRTRNFLPANWRGTVYIRGCVALADAAVWTTAASDAARGSVTVSDARRWTCADGATVVVGGVATSDAAVWTAAASDERCCDT